MFRPIDQHPEDATVHLDFEGRTLAAPPGDPFASALIRPGLTASILSPIGVRAGSIPQPRAAGRAAG